LKILMVSAEAEPFASTGGLGEATSLLSQSLAQHGHEVALILPKYLAVDRNGFRTEPIDLPLLYRIEGTEQTGWIHRGALPHSGIPAYFVTNDHFFNRTGIYQEGGKDYPDNLARFTFFCRAVAEFLESDPAPPDIVHCHDWPTALVPTYLKTRPELRRLSLSTKTIFTFHDLAYQGFFPKDQLPTTGLGWDLFNPEGIEFYGDLNLLKAGMLYADHVTTVSERYAAEAMTPEFGRGMESIVSAIRDRLTGILDGIDYETWNPETDPYLPSPYGPEDLTGKQNCRRETLTEFGLSDAEGTPLVGVVTSHPESSEIQFLASGLEVPLLGNEIRLIVVAKGEKESLRDLYDLQTRFPGSAAIRREIDDELSHRVVAASDLFLVSTCHGPSPPNELAALKYGAAPVVRGCGGAADAVRDYNEAQKDGFGFVYHNPEAHDLLQTVRRALDVFRDRTAWAALQRRAMGQDCSWNTTAERYERVYESLLESLP